MHKILLALFTYLILISEGTLFQIFQPVNLQEEMHIIPRFTLVIICFIGIFLSPKLAIIYSLSFGFLYDLVYTDLIGIFTFSFVFISYFMSLLARYFNVNLIIALLINICAVTLLELFGYGVHLLIGLAMIPYETFLYSRLIPTLILNGMFILIIFYPLRKALRSYKIREEEK